jgi:hypothetical protein
VTDFWTKIPYAWMVAECDLTMLKGPPIHTGGSGGSILRLGMLGLLIHPFDFLYNCRDNVGCPAHLAAQRIGSGLPFIRILTRKSQDVNYCCVAPKRRYSGAEHV